jgi:hypothetical protein
MNRQLISRCVLGVSVIISMRLGADTASNTAVTSANPAATFPCDSPQLLLSPYVWKRTGAGPMARAEAGIPGAYLKASFEGTTTIGLEIDGTANAGCPTNSMPVVSYSVDDSPFKVVQLSQTGNVFNLPLADGLNKSAPHRLQFFFRACDLGQKRWRSSIGHLRIAGITLDSGARLLSCASRPKTAIVFGDSITEGVGVDGLFTSWQSLSVNNACATWFAFACAALDCEYGQLGTGGQGMTRTTMAMPPLPQTWDHYDATTSRLSQGRLLPEPDYVFCEMGTNDFEEDAKKRKKDMDITASYLKALRDGDGSCCE